MVIGQELAPSFARWSARVQQRWGRAGQGMQSEYECRERATNLCINPEFGLPAFRRYNLHNSVFSALFGDAPYVLHGILELLGSWREGGSLRQAVRTDPLWILFDGGISPLHGRHIKRLGLSGAQRGGLIASGRAGKGHRGPSSRLCCWCRSGCGCAIGFRSRRGGARRRSSGWSRRGGSARRNGDWRHRGGGGGDGRRSRRQW